MHSPAALPPPSVRTVVLQPRRSTPPQPPSTFSYVTFRANGAVVDDTGRHRRVTVVCAPRASRWLRALRWVGAAALVGTAIALAVTHPEHARAALEVAIDFGRRVAELMG